MKIPHNLYKINLNKTGVFAASKEEARKDHAKTTQLLAKLSFVDNEKLITFDESVEDGKYHTYNILQSDSYILDKDQVFELALSGLGYSVAQTIETKIDVSQALMDLAEKPIKLVSQEGSVNNYNTKCEVHMPSYAMTLYNEVMIKEDCCTDELQSCLISGWRIIAACPQPDQRRPDYVLGRFNAGEVESVSAKR